MYKALACVLCEADFTLRHDMDEDHYRITFCPFCGEELDNEEEYDLIEDEDE
jgi:hypothetical protein